MFYVSKLMTEVRLGNFFYITKRNIRGRVLSRSWGFYQN